MCVCGCTWPGFRDASAKHFVSSTIMTLVTFNKAYSGRYTAVLIAPDEESCTRKSFQLTSVEVTCNNNVVSGNTESVFQDSCISEH